MATKDSSMTQADACTERRMEAACSIFGEIAGDLHSAVELTHEAVQSTEPAAMLLALAALLEKVGAVADRAGKACGAPGVKGADSWLLSRRGAKNMAELEALRGAA